MASERRALCVLLALPSLLSDIVAMAALPPKDAALITAASKKGANLHDPYCLKRVLDDATSEVWLNCFFSLGFRFFIVHDVAG
jgi:hypothetical protein